MDVRYLYTILFYLITPIILLRLLWRSFKQPAYRQRLPERFGWYSLRLPKCLWVHAVSVGEVIAAASVVKKLKELYPGWQIVVTTMTPTGAERVKAIFADSVYHLYLPYDLPFAVQRFLQAINPATAIMMETELWPNLITECYKRQIPVCLLNARLSASSARGYSRVSGFMKTVLQQINVIAANGKADAERFIALGADSAKVVVTGNIKFDLELPASLIENSQKLRDKLGKNRFVWIAASTHVGEEEKILQAHQLLQQQDPHALLILVPRHPNRFANVKNLAATLFSTEHHSSHPVSISEQTAVYIGDTMGELLLLYSAADVAFIGGSLVPHGGHNFLEPALLKKPVITGNYLKNFFDISELFVANDALIKVENAEALAKQLFMLKNNLDERVVRGYKAYEVVVANRGALNRQIQLLSKVLQA